MTQRHYKLHPVRLKGAAITIKIAQASLKCLRGVKAYLSTEDLWIKDEYEDTKSVEIPTSPFGYNDDSGTFSSAVTAEYREIEGAVCLIGGVEKIDGPGELLANNILQQVVNGDKILDTEFVPSKAEFDPSAGEWECGIWGGFELYRGTRDAGYAQEFNDDDRTTFNDIHRVLDYAIKQNEKLIIDLRAARKK